MMGIDAMLSSKVNTWGTPCGLFLGLNNLFGFTLDACAVKSTAKCKRFVSPDGDGLNHSWDGEVVWNNCPYDDAGNWTPKARNESLEGRVVSANLLPVRAGTAWWARGVLSEDGAAGRLRDSWYDSRNRVMWLRWQRLVTGVHYVAGRITFDGVTKSGKPNNAPFDSAIVIHATPGMRPKKRSGVTDQWPRW